MDGGAIANPDDMIRYDDYVMTLAFISKYRAGSKLMPHIKDDKPHQFALHKNSLSSVLNC